MEEKNFKDPIIITGGKPGKTSVILSGVHGNERGAMHAMQEVLSTGVEIDSGTVIFLYGNPKAIIKNKRYVDSNLNRMFLPLTDLKSNKDNNDYEYLRAQYLKKYLNKADTVLDLHTSNNKKSKPFIICEDNAKNIVKFLPIATIVSGFDEHEPGGTDYYMNQLGKIGICMECGSESDPNSTQVALEGVSTFLKIQGHISGDVKESAGKKYSRLYKKYYTKSNNFILAKNFDDFEKVSAGDLIGVDGGKNIYAEKDGFVLFAYNRDFVGAEAFLLGT